MKVIKKNNNNKILIRSCVTISFFNWFTSVSPPSPVCSALSISNQQNPASAAHLVGPVRHCEGELVGVLLLLAAVNVLDATGCQIGLCESVDSNACGWWREREGVKM